MPWQMLNLGCPWAQWEAVVFLSAERDRRAPRRAREVVPLCTLPGVFFPQWCHVGSHSPALFLSGVSALGLKGPTCAFWKVRWERRSHLPLAPSWVQCLPFPLTQAVCWEMAAQGQGRCQAWTRAGEAPACPSTLCRPEIESLCTRGPMWPLSRASFRVKDLRFCPLVTWFLC